MRCLELTSKLEELEIEKSHVKKKMR